MSENSHPVLKVKNLNFRVLPGRVRGLLQCVMEYSAKGGEVKQETLFFNALSPQAYQAYQQELSALDNLLETDAAVARKEIIFRYMRMQPLFRRGVELLLLRKNGNRIPLKYPVDDLETAEKYVEDNIESHLKDLADGG